MNPKQHAKIFVLLLFVFIAAIAMLGGIGPLGGDIAAKAVMAQANTMNFLPIVVATEGGGPPACHPLTITREGEGSLPTASPDRSPGCEEEHSYFPGQTIILSGAAPLPGWAIAGWIGTIQDSLTSSTNGVVMPDNDHTAGVKYILDEVCYELTVGHTGQGVDPVASPLKSVQCIEDGTYLSGEVIFLSGAVPADQWFIAGWEGTNDDASTAEDNTVTMPAANHTAKVHYTENCYPLTISHTGQGSDPITSPSKSATCIVENTFIAGEEIQLSGAVPDLNWHITGWNGTDDDASTADSNSLTMPMGTHEVRVDYAQNCYELTLDHTGQGTDPEASPVKSEVCDANDHYVAGEIIQLSGAVPDEDWFIGNWTGTDNDSSNAATNTLTMPGADHLAAVNYAESCYKLTVYHTGQGSDPVLSPQKSSACTQNNTYVPGESVKLEDAIPAAGWEVGSWTGTRDDASTEDNNRVKMPSSNHFAAVNYVRSCYELTRTHSGNGKDPVASPTKSPLCTQTGTYIAGEVISLSATADPGWFVDAWSGTNDDSSTANNNTLTMPTQNHTVDVTYKGTCFVLTVGKTGQGLVPAASPTNSVGCTNGKYTAGESIQLLNANPATDWYITGWTGTNNNASTNPSNSVTMPPSAHAATVVYDQCYLLTLSHSGQGTDPVASPIKSTLCDSAGYYVDGQAINLSGASPAAGWAIKGWTGTDSNGSTAATNTLTMPVADHAASVVYEQCYALTLSHTGNGTDPAATPPNSPTCSSPGEYIAGQAINLSGAVPDPTWAIASWTGTNNDGSTAATNTVTMPASVHTAEVNYEQPCYNLTLNHTGQGSDPGASPSKSASCTNVGEYVEGQVVNLNGASPDPGWAIIGWIGTDDDSSDKSTNKVTMPGSNHTATVIYGQCQQLTLGHTGSGSDPTASLSATCNGAGYYLEGETINLSGAVPDPTWAITGWTGTDDDSSTAATNSATMPNGSHAVTVVYEQPCYVLTLSHSGSGSDPVAAPTKSAACSSTGEYVEGEVINLSGAVPSPNWAIQGWTGTNSNGSTSATNTVTMPANAHAASVIYYEQCFQLTLSHSGQGTDPVASPTKSGDCASTGYYVENESINLSGAAPATNWAIKEWTGTDSNGSTAATNTVTMPANAHAASVVYEQCYLLTLGHTGQGSDPVASPVKSATCNSVNGYYLSGALIGLSGAVPDSGWGITGWTGTLNDASVLDTNSVSMPASDHAAGVTYELIAVSSTEDAGYQFYLRYRWR